MQKTCEVVHEAFCPSCIADQKAECADSFRSWQRERHSLTFVAVNDVKRSCNWLTVNNCQTLLEFLAA